MTKQELRQGRKEIAYPCGCINTYYMDNGQLFSEITFTCSPHMKILKDVKGWTR